MQNYVIMKMILGDWVDVYYEKWAEIAHLSEIPNSDLNIQKLEFNDLKDNERIVSHSDVEIEISPLTKIKNRK